MLNLDALGRAIRSARQDKGLTIKVRQYLWLVSQVHFGCGEDQGNISVSKLIQLARALDVRASD